MSGVFLCVFHLFTVILYFVYVYCLVMVRNLKSSDGEKKPPIDSPSLQKVSPCELFCMYISLIFLHSPALSMLGIQYFLFAEKVKKTT